MFGHRRREAFGVRPVYRRFALGGSRKKAREMKAALKRTQSKR
jgi:hypothetical protein